MLPINIKKNLMFDTWKIIYINLVSLCVCDGGFGGWGKGEAGEATGEKSGRVCL
jgi:hypothetical protein